MHLATFQPAKLSASAATKPDCVLAAFDATPLAKLPKIL